MKILTVMSIIVAAVVLPVAAQEAGPADALWELYRQGRFAEVVQQGKALLSTGTETAQLNLAVGRGLADQEQFAEAEIFLQRAVDLDASDRTWVYAWAQVYLGNCRWQAGDVDGARRAWTLARDSEATANATRSANMNLLGLGLAAVYDAWTTFTSEHFLFRFSDRLASLDRAAYARAHEDAYAAITAWFGGSPDQPIRFFVWADQDEATAAGMPQLGFARPELNLVHCRAEQTVGHEMTHVIAWAAVRPTRAVGLINEGTAVYHDRTGRDRLAAARTALATATTESGAPLPPVALRALWDDWSLLPGDVSYPVAGAWVERLVAKGGRDKYLEFFVDQSRGHAREVYEADLETWIEEFEMELRR